MTILLCAVKSNHNKKQAKGIISLSYTATILKNYKKYLCARNRKQNLIFGLICKVTRLCKNNVVTVSLFVSKFLKLYSD